jgi:hypothetical protein
MELREILSTTDPNTLKARIGEIDREVGRLMSERAAVDHRFQHLLSKNAQTLTSLPVRPLHDRPPRTGWEDSNPSNNQEFRP